jgi:hypothetical protein
MWIRRGVIAVIVFVLLMWASLAWAIQSNAGNPSHGASAAVQTRMAVQENWQCSVAAGPDCVLMKLLAPH